jgi:hypothetical protein
MLTQNVDQAAENYNVHYVSMKSSNQYFKLGSKYTLQARVYFSNSVFIFNIALQASSHRI